MSDKPKESPIIKPEEFEHEPEVIDWSTLLESDLPEDEVPRWTKAIKLGTEQRVRDITRAVRVTDEEEIQESFPREDVLLLDWKIEQLKSKLAIMSVKMQNLHFKEKCPKCQR